MSSRLGDVGRVLILGGGNMGGAMVRGWVEAGIGRDRVHVVDPRLGDALAPLVRDGSVRHSQSVPDGEAFETVVLAVKPQMMADAVPALRAVVKPGTLVISIAAGTTTATIRGLVGEAAIVRAMPNTPALIGRGISGCFAEAQVGQDARGRAEALLQACGAVVWLDRESDIDAVTAVSGSGPAYVFLLTETLAAAGEAAGLSRELAMTLARHTVAGAGELVIRSNDSPDMLRRNVTSPNGTTQAALDVLMGENGLALLMRGAVEAARKRSAELSKA